MLLDLTGRKKALLIGVHDKNNARYTGRKKNVLAMKKLLVEKFGFQPDQMRILLGNNEETAPTYNIRKGMKWILEGSQQNDSLVLFYSGHGTGRPDYTGDEWDGQDECIVPLDSDSTGFICDDDIYDLLVRKLPKGCRLTAFFDCCHSGTMLDLPYEFNEIGQAIEPDPSSYENIYQLRFQMCGKTVVRPKCNPTINETKKDPQHDVVAFSSCHDTGTCRSPGNMYFGCIKVDSKPYFVKTIVGILNSSKTLSHKEILMKMKQSINDELGQEQKAQFSAGYDIDMNSEFSM